MSSTSRIFTKVPDSRSTPRQILETRAEFLAEQAFERAEQRRLQLAEQRSSLNTPEARIRIWEKVHELRLPLNSQHAIVDIVAAATGLTREQVQQEQEARSAS